MAGVLDYSSTAASNTAINGIGIQGSSAISNFDNALRQLMADIAAGIIAGSFSGNGYVAKSGAYTVVAADRGKIIDCTAALTLSLTAAATLGAGFVFIVKANGGAVTVDPDTTETINGASTSLTVADGSSAIVACTGTAWHSITMLASVDAVGTASTTAAGVVELATDAEAQTGTDTARAITPANLQAVTATESRKGVVELATTAEASTGTDTARAVTPAGLKAVIDALPSSTADYGAGNAALAFGEVGTYVFAYRTDDAAQGTTYAGSSLEPAGVTIDSTITDDTSVSANLTKGSTALSGTWRAMGRAQVGASGAGATLYLRTV